MKDPLNDGISSAEILSCMGNDLTIANAARVSMARESKELTERDRRLVGMLMRERHGSPFEHVVMSFRIRAPIFVVRQWQRHRIASYNEQSGRWSEFGYQFWIPARELTELHWEYHDASSESYNRYQRLLAAGEPKERARAVLIQSLYTSFILTINARALMNFISLRNAEEAQREIRVYGEAMEDFMQDVLPVTHAAFLANDRRAP